jgi:hypothetical protein
VNEVLRYRCNLCKAHVKVPVDCIGKGCVCPRCRQTSLVMDAPGHRTRVRISGPIVPETRVFLYDPEPPPEPPPVVLEEWPDASPPGDPGR